LFERVQCNLKTKGFCNIGWRENLAILAQGAEPKMCKEKGI